MEKRIFNIDSHYLIEIDDTSSFGSQGTITTTFSWDVYIASKGTEYRGMAIERQKQLSIPWTTLVENDLLDEMTNIIERSMVKL